MPSFSFILLTVSEKKNFEYFFENLPSLSPRQPINVSDLGKSRMKHGGLLNKHFCKKKTIQISPIDLAEIFNFHFSHYKSMGTISCRTNQSSYPTGIKNTTYVGLMSYACMPSFGFIPLWFLRRRFIKTFLRKFTLFAAQTTNQIHRFGQKSYET